MSDMSDDFRTHCYRCMLHVLSYFLSVSFIANDELKMYNSIGVYMFLHKDFRYMFAVLLKYGPKVTKCDPFTKRPKVLPWMVRLATNEFFRFCQRHLRSDIRTGHHGNHRWHQIQIQIYNAERCYDITRSRGTMESKLPDTPIYFGIIIS